MKRVTAIGGIFFKTSDVQKLKDWYRDHLGFQVTQWGATFPWGDLDEKKETLSRTEWSPFKADSDYFAPSTLPYMINYRVHDLEKLLEALSKEGVQVVGDMQSFEYGKFGWAMDPEGRKMELWEPVDDKFGDDLKPWTARVNGLGGVFFKSDNPEEMKKWYKTHFGIEENFMWKNLNYPASKEAGRTVWCPFDANTDYFNPSDKPWMFNYRVKDIKTLVKTLASEGVKIHGIIDETPYGNFVWVIDCDGTKVELWEPLMN